MIAGRGFYRLYYAFLLHVYTFVGTAVGMKHKSFSLASLLWSQEQRDSSGVTMDPGLSLSQHLLWLMMALV